MILITSPASSLAMCVEEFTPASSLSLHRQPLTMGRVGGHKRARANSSAPPASSNPAKGQSSTQPQAPEVRPKFAAVATAGGGVRVLHNASLWKLVQGAVHWLAASGLMANLSNAQSRVCEFLFWSRSCLIIGLAFGLRFGIVLGF